MFGLRACGGFLVVMVLTTAPVAAQQAVPAGHIKIATGAAYIVRQNTSLPAKPGDPVFATDTLRTQTNGAIGVTLADDTRVSLGPDSEMRLERYVFAPADAPMGRSE